MERSENSLSRPTVASIVIVLFHVVGLAGFFIGAVRPLFLQIVPFHLLLMLLVICYSYGRLTARFITFAVLIYLLGYVAEWIGVHKSWIFGDYNYGRTLGTKVYDIPLTMGVNWFLLIYVTGVTMDYTPIKLAWLRILLGATLLVLLDLLIEPVAQRFDYWHWTDSQVPLKNYLGWFAVSTLSLLLFELFGLKKENVAAPVLLVVQFFFFGLMLLV